MLVLVLLVAVLESPPPLPGAVMESLAAVQDDRDAPDTGFFALLNHVRDWPAGVESTGAPPALEHDELVTSPAAHRGTLMLIEGRLEQVRQLDRPLETVQEWFVRLADGRPVMVYAPLPGGPLLQPGDDVMLGGYFYKRLQMEDRQGNARVYPVFIGGQPRAVIAESRAVDTALLDARSYVTRTVWLVGGIALLLVLMFGLLMLIRRSKRTAPHTGNFGDVDPEPPMPSLPDDPADAMAEMMRRNSEGP